jgi:hypothetical protein
MKEGRKKIILITLISYFLFIIVLHVSGIDDENGIGEDKYIKNRTNFSVMNSHAGTAGSVYINNELNSGMDPTPIPPVPLNFILDESLEPLD